LKYKHNHDNGKWEYEIMYDSYELTQYNSVWLMLPWLVFIEDDSVQFSLAHAIVTHFCCSWLISSAHAAM